jgi:MinD superfamily P-loop ATPase
MKELLILSDKGGAGKSSVTASIAALLSGTLNITLADTDVNAPNLHIINKASLIKSAPIYASEKAFIDMTACTGCMGCTDMCSFGALMRGNGTPVLLQIFCEACGACIKECPEKAIEIRQIHNGYLHLFDAGGIKLVSGKLSIGQGSTGKIVDIIKSEARIAAQNDNADYLIIDGPPGLCCPVISSLKGCDAVLAITEPTTPALSDLERLLNVVEYSDPAVGVIINKVDINPAGADAVRRSMEERGIPVIGEIPYDIHVSFAITEGVPVEICFPESKAAEALRTITSKILSLFETKQQERDIDHEQDTCMR